MNKYPKCPHCGNTEDGDTIWNCKDCGCVHCAECESDHGSCPNCGSGRLKQAGYIDVEVLDEDDRDENEDGVEVFSRCPRCKNSEEGETIWQCKDCEYIHCASCDSDSGSCPNCGSSRVKQIGSIDNEYFDENEDDEEEDDDEES